MTLMKISSEHKLADPLMVVQIFCRLMLQISLLAIPVYLALFIFAVPFDMDAGKLKGIAMSVPAVIFLMSAIAYSIGFLATPPERQPDSFDAVAPSRRRIHRLKMRMIIIGSGLFSLGVTVGTLLLIKAHL